MSNVTPLTVAQATVKVATPKPKYVPFPLQVRDRIDPAIATKLRSGKF